MQIEFCHRCFVIYVWFSTLGPPSLTSRPENIYEDIGKTVEIPCQGDGNPKPVAYWKKNDRPLPTDSRFEIKEDGTLVIFEMQSHDAGTYECSLENVLGKVSVNVIVKLNIQEVDEGMILCYIILCLGLWYVHSVGVVWAFLIILCLGLWYVHSVGVVWAFLIILCLGLWYVHSVGVVWAFLIILCLGLWYVHSVGVVWAFLIILCLGLWYVHSVGVVWAFLIILCLGLWYVHSVGVVWAFLIFVFEILEIAEIKVGKKTNYCLNVSLVFPILSILIDMPVVIIYRIQEGNKSLSMLKT